MATTSEIKDERPWYKRGSWHRENIVCQEFQGQFKAVKGIWHSRGKSDPSYPKGSYVSLILLTLCIILCASTITLFVLRPLRMPFIAQMIGGVLVCGVIFSDETVSDLFLYSYAVPYVLNTLSFLGFTFHSLMLGVETNMRVIIQKVTKKSAIIGFSGFFLSLTFSAISLLFFAPFNDWKYVVSAGFFRLSLLNAQTFFMVTCHHLNDLGIGNSELGRLACTIALVLDLSVLVLSFISAEVIEFAENLEWKRQASLVMFYVGIFGCVRPYILRIADQCIGPMKRRHFAFIILVAVLIDRIGNLLLQMFAVFMFALSLPVEPLSSTLSMRLDTITTSLFFPIYCAMQGLQTNVGVLEPTEAFQLEVGLIFGSVGKFLGTYLSSMFLGLPLNKSLALSLIMSSKGLFDIASLGLWANNDNWLTIPEYTVAAFHFLVCSGAFLPLVRYLYKPSSEYSTILGTSIMDLTENSPLKTMACIHTEENIPGIIRLIEAFDPSRSRPVPLIALQLIQQTGRAALPIHGILDQVKASGILGPKLILCERIVEYLTELERMHKGHVQVQHFVSMAPYETMHNDICSIAYERDVSLIILPFHDSYGNSGDKNSKSSSMLPIRSLNKMILDKTPCSVGILIDRNKLHLHISMTQVYRISIIYIGGIDDQEALAYTNLFATNPNISITIIWLKSPHSADDYSACDYKLIGEIKMKIKTNGRLSFDEVIVQDGAETTDFIMTITNKVDLVVVGRYHDPNCGPLFGLSDGWTEFPELGILGDMLASSDFHFSVLIVQSSVGDDQ